ncbi:MAG: hypothetical protein B6I34_00775 [Anaerolineaceae bacterium 4572_32.1]|nr:MAG: hypothetical protein B6I34_00775 [Anaerolineaceae bacterium 4572_32.1]
MHKKLNLTIILALLVSMLLAGTVSAQSPAAIQDAANTYFSGGAKNITADALYENLNDGDTSNDPFILSVRKAEHYAAGHIPGAVNISAGALFSEENLATLPTDKQIVVYCYTGQTASQVTSALNMLGYDAANLKFGFGDKQIVVYCYTGHTASQVASVLNMLGYDAANMLYGMQAWTMDTDVRAKFFNADVHSFDYAFEGTAAPAAEEEAAAEEEEAAPEALPETGADPVSLAPVGLVIFGVLSMGVGVVGYAVNRRKSA